MTTLSHADLIYFGAIGQLKIWALADGWLVNFYGFDLIETPSDLIRTNAVKKSFQPYRISGPVQLYPETLVRFEANPNAKVTKFVAPLSPDADQDYDAYEYQICGDSGADEGGDSIAISKCTLVVFHEDIPSVMKTDASPDEKPLKTRERRSMQLIIVALARMNGLDLKTPTKTASVISNQMASMHEEISQKAIEDHLNKIPGEFKVIQSVKPPAIA